MPLASSSATVELRTGRGALELLDERWDELLARQERPNPTLSAAWLLKLAELDTGTPLVAVASENGRIDAGVALQLHRRGGPLGVRAATWLGPVEQQCSPEVLVEPGRPQLAAAVLEAALEQADVLTVAAARGGPTERALAAVAPWLRREPLGPRWWTPWPPPRHTYVRRRNGQDLRRAERRGVTVEIRVASTPDEVAAALARLFRLHRARWDARDNETLRFARTHALRRWNAAAVGALAASGRARIVEVIENGRVVAATLGLLHGRGGLAHTQAIAPDAVLRDPGHIALLASLEALAEAGAAAVELGQGTGEPGSPKHRLGAVSEPVHELFATRSPSRQLLLATARRLTRAAR